MIREIEGLLGNTAPAAVNLAILLAEFDSLTAAGERPTLERLVLFEAVNVRPHMWEAALRSGGLEVLEVGTVYRLSQFYNELNLGFAQIEQLRVFSERYILPNLGRPAAFYDPATGELRRQYRFYVSGFRRLRRLAGNITFLGRALLADLERAEGISPDSVAPAASTSGSARAAGPRTERLAWASRRYRTPVRLAPGCG